MPFAKLQNRQLFYRLEGDEQLPVLILSNSLGADHGMWAPQMPAFLRYFRVLRYDTIGHGASERLAGDYTIELLARDVLALADGLSIQKFAFCGLSLGGMIGQWLGINVSERLTGLVLANTSAHAAPREQWETRRQTVLQQGMGSIVDAAMQRFFSPEKSRRRDAAVATARTVFLSIDPVGYAGCCAAIRDMDYTAHLGKVSVRTLVVGSTRDPSTPWEGHGDVLAREIPSAVNRIIDAAHLSNVEQPHTFATAVLDFLLEAGNVRDSYYDDGQTVRRAVLGNAHVDVALANTTDFTRDFQELVTRYAWGTIWIRPGLDERTRRLLTLAMMAALGRWEEFSLHVRAGLEEDLEVSDLKEMLLQVAIYAGVPAANTGFHLAQEQLDARATRKPKIQPA